jgi:hypothetical protein
MPMPIPTPTPMGIEGYSYSYSYSGRWESCGREGGIGVWIEYEYRPAG